MLFLVFSLSNHNIAVTLVRAYVQRETYKLEATAQDKGYPPLSRSVEVQIDVVDRANNPPVWDHTVYGPIFIRENFPVGAKVVSVKARSVPLSTIVVRLNLSVLIDISVMVTVRQHEGRTAHVPSVCARFIQQVGASTCPLIIFFSINKFLQIYFKKLHFVFLFVDFELSFCLLQFSTGLSKLSNNINLLIEVPQYYNYTLFFL